MTITSIENDRNEFGSSEDVLRDARYAVSISGRNYRTVEELAQEWAERYCPNADVTTLAEDAIKTVENQPGNDLLDDPLKAFLDDHLDDVLRFVARTCKLYIHRDYNLRLTLTADGEHKEFGLRSDLLIEKLREYPPDTLVGGYFDDCACGPDFVTDEGDEIYDDRERPYDVCRVRDLTD